jgi:histidinol-phosphatase (PHP family)
MKPIDLHVHTPYCGHATGSAEETIQYAIRHDFYVLGFAEHFPYPEKFREPVPDCVVPRHLWPAYLDEIWTLQNAYPDFDIRLGAEVDFLPGYENEILDELSKGTFDYIYGSVHLVENICVDYKDEYLQEHLERLGGADGLWEKYWQTLERMIRTGMCDIISHIDLPKKLASAKPTRDQTEGFRHILKLIREYDLVMEINTGGIDRTFQRESYPSEHILRHAADFGIEMTLGSDAHAPKEIGRYFSQATALLNSLGWNRIVIFHNRQKEYISLVD